MPRLTSPVLKNILSVGVAFAATSGVLTLAACGEGHPLFAGGTTTSTSTVTTTSTGTSTDTSTSTSTSTSTTTVTTTTTSTSAGTGAVAGVTVANDPLLPSGTNTLANVSLLSTSTSTAPIQLGVGSNGTVLSASVGEGGTTGAVVSPLVSGVQGLVGTLQNGGLSAVTTPLDTATANTPLAQLLNVKLGNVQLLGSSSTPAAITADVASGNQLLNVTATTPAGVPDPLSSLAGPASQGATALNGAITSSPLGSVVGQLTTAGVQGSSALNGGLAALTTPLGGVVQTLTAPLTNPSSLGSGLGSLTGALGSLGTTLSGATSGSAPATSALGTLTKSLP